jgi:hypothetical protein
MAWSQTTERLERKVKALTGLTVWIQPSTWKHKGRWCVVNANGGGCKYFDYIKEILPWFQMRQLFVDRGWLEQDALRENCDQAEL